jgi:hypothetical protein
MEMRPANLCSPRFSDIIITIRWGGARLVRGVVGQTKAAALSHCRLVI